jgi:FkbM family methyltransferase
MRRSPALAVRRVLQTPRTFSNFPEVFVGLLSGSKQPVLTFKTRDGLVIECPNVAGARVPVYEIFAEDAYRLDELVGGLGDSFKVLDIGGQIGCFSIAMASRFPGAVIHAYEASPVSAKIADSNVARNGLADQVTVHAIAISDTAGELVLQDNGAGSGLNGTHGVVGDSDAASSENMRGVTVPCITFREAVAAAGGDVTVVKIDTEGAEYSIVLGSQPEDWAGVERVVIEYHPVPGRSWTELETFFDAAGFTTDHHVPGAHELGTRWLVRN